MKKNKYTNIGYFFFLEHKKHLETNNPPQTKTKKNKAKQQPPLFQITLLENCYYWRSHFRCKGICFISLRIWFEPWDPQWKEAADSWKLSFGLHTCAHSLCPMLPFSSLTHNNKIQLQKKHFPRLWNITIEEMPQLAFPKTMEEVNWHQDLWTPIENTHSYWNHLRIRTVRTFFRFWIRSIKYFFFMVGNSERMNHLDVFSHLRIVTGGHCETELDQDFPPWRVYIPKKWYPKTG